MDIVISIIEWITAHPHHTYVAVFAVAFLESLPIVGGLVPGSSAIIGMGALVASGAADIWIVVLTAAAGATVGDGSSYWFGRHYGKTIKTMWPFRRYPEVFKRSEDFFDAYGGKSIFIARFIPPVRAVVPLVAGILRVEPRKFFLANIPGALGWAALHALSGVGIAKSFVLLGSRIEHGVVAAVVLCAGFGALVWLSRLLKVRKKTKR